MTSSFDHEEDTLSLDHNLKSYSAFFQAKLLEDVVFAPPIPNTQLTNIDLINFFRELGDLVSKANAEKGFHDDDINLCAVGKLLEHKELTTRCDNKTSTEYIKTIENLLKCRRLMLITTELAEACEGIRKDEMDDKLPHRSSESVELADAVIRILDYCGFYDIDLGGAIAEKLKYNITRKYLHGKLF